MKRIWCRIVGHDWTPVSRIGLAARPGGILPSLDGMVAYKPDSNGRHLACRRCRFVDPVEYPEPAPSTPERAS